MVSQECQTQEVIIKEKKEEKVIEYKNQYAQTVKIKT